MNHTSESNFYFNSNLPLRDLKNVSLIVTVVFLPISGNMTHTHWPKHWVFDIKFENIWKLENVPPKVCKLDKDNSDTDIF